VKLPLLITKESQQPSDALFPCPQESGVGVKVDDVGAGESVGLSVALAVTVTARVPEEPVVTATVTSVRPGASAVPTSRMMDWPAVHPASTQLVVKGVQSARTVFP